jgi:NTE family protein
MAWKSATAHSFALLFSVVFSVAGSAQQTAVPGAVPAASFAANPRSLPPAAPKGRPLIGIALEGGGALGLAHIGVLQWMEEHRIPVDRIAGTSMGALVGAFYASGDSPAQMRAIAVSNDFQRIFTLETPYVDLSFRRRQDRRELPDSITGGLEHGVELRDALFSERGVNEFLETNLPAYDQEALDYDQLPIPFRCVATDLNTLTTVTFASGPLPHAVRASISIPGIFPPVQGRNGHMLVDGGILDNLPTDVLRHNLHADIVIAVRLPGDAPATPDTSSIVSVLNRAFSAGIERNAEQGQLLADLVVVVPTNKFSATDYSKAAELITTGYQAAEKSSAALLRYALDDRDWQAYVAARQSRRRPQPGVVDEVRVEGGDASAKQSLIGDVQTLKGKPETPATTIDALKRIQSNGGYSATFETFAPQPVAGSTAAPDTGVLIRLKNDTIGPPYLLIGPELSASTSNVTRSVLNLRLVDQNLGGFGSELRGSAQLGYLTNLSTEYYFLLTPGGFFLQPRAEILRQPVYLWADQKRIAERFQQNLVAGFEAGRTIGNSMQVYAEWSAEDTRWALRTGSGGGPYLTGTAQTGQLHFTLDKEASGAISPNGFRLSASAGAFYHAVGSSNAPLVMLSTARTWAFDQRNILGLSADINSYLRADVAQPFRFTLGGPRQLSASSFDEYRGTDTALVRAGYLRRIAALPLGLGQGLYGVLGYEAGEIWSPEQGAILRQDGTLGLVGATPAGTVSVGVSIGDAGHRKVFITVGRLF